jgi:hypothetical protein
MSVSFMSIFLAAPARSFARRSSCHVVPRTLEELAGSLLRARRRNGAAARAALFSPGETPETSAGDSTAIPA